MQENSKDILSPTAKRDKSTTQRRKKGQKLSSRTSIEDVIRKHRLQHLIEERKKIEATFNAR